VYTDKVYHRTNRNLINQSLLYNRGYNKNVRLPATSEIPGAVPNGQDYSQILNRYRKPSQFGKKKVSLLYQDLKYVKS
jgi:hypothetical protein